MCEIAAAHGDWLKPNKLEDIPAEHFGISEIGWPEVSSKINHSKELTKPEKELWQSTIKLPCASDYQVQGEVVKGFGRGSRLLGVPTGTLFYSDSECFSWYGFDKKG